jgi:hypothetical protein
VPCIGNRCQAVPANSLLKLYTAYLGLAWAPGGLPKGTATSYVLVFIAAHMVKFQQVDFTLKKVMCICRQLPEAAHNHRGP